MTNSESRSILRCDHSVPDCSRTLYGSRLKAAGPVGSGPLTVDEFLAMDWDAVRREHPELVGAWIYASETDMLQVMQQLGE